MTNTNSKSKQAGLQNRREFIRTAAQTTAAVAAVTTFPFLAKGRVLGANDRIGVGLIGVGGRGSMHLQLLQWMQDQSEYNIAVVGVCDTYGPRRRKAGERVNAKEYTHHHDLLANPNIDAVCIATPDRHHIFQGLDAIRAGKDVYCEKPMGHWSQFDLSKRFYEETRKLKRVVQIGNQGNSSAAWKKLANFIKAGDIGAVSHIQAGFYRLGDWGERMPIPDPNAKPGPDLDWKAFLGDAPKVPFTVDRYFSWRKYLDYAGGPCTDLFPHVFTPFVGMFDLKFPSRVVAAGGIFKYTTYDREVPDTFTMCLDFDDRKLSVILTCTEANGFQTDPAIRGDAGTITLQNPGGWDAGFDSLTVTPFKGKPTVVKGEKPNTTLLHWENFLHCMRTREKPVSDIEFGLHVQAALSSAMMGFLNKKVAQFNDEKQQIIL